MYIRDAKQCFGVHLKMHLKTLLFVISVMSQLDKAWSLQVSSYKSIECMQPCNLSGSPLSCTVHTVTLPAGKVQCYRLCGEVHSLGRSTPCDVFLVNTTIDGTTWCYVCDYDDSGEYLLSQLDGVQAFVMQDLTNKGKYSMLTVRENGSKYAQIWTCMKSHVLWFLIPAIHWLGLGNYDSRYDQKWPAPFCLPVLIVKTYLGKNYLPIISLLYSLIPKMDTKVKSENMTWGPSFQVVWFSLTFTVKPLRK